MCESWLPSSTVFLTDFPVARALKINLVPTTITTTICSDACPLSCASAEAYKFGPMHETAGMGKLINAALLSLLMRHV